VNHLISVCAAIITSGAVAVPMPDPADYVGKQIVEVDVPDDATVSLLLADGINALACRPAPGVGPWVVDGDDLAFIRSLGLSATPRIRDLSAYQAAKNAQRLAIRSEHGGQRGLDSFYDDFRTLSELNARLDQIIADHGGLASGIMIGQSHEGRDIRGVVLNAGGGDKPAVLFNGCQHAREWISPMTTINIADALADGYGVDPTITALLDKVEVIVIPVVNPDGFEYTYASGGDRYWRKNRRNNAGSCEGVDLNRNWDADWNGGESTSTDPCSDIYVGPGPMSEPEVAALGDYCLAHGNIRAQIDFHSYSELVLEPRGYTTAPPPDWDELHAVGGDISDAIAAVHGTYYTHDNPCNILYCASGTLIDWPYDMYGALSYTIELRPGSGDWGGFDPPPSEIRPCAEENFNGVLALIEHISTPIGIELTSGAPNVVSTETPTSFPVRIFERAEAPDPATARLLYRGTVGDFDEAPLSHLGGENYEATLPTFMCSESPEFYIAVDGVSGGSAAYPGGAPNEVLTAVVASDVEMAFDDNGETDPGWSVSGDASDGQWERGVPAGGGLRGDPPTDADGSGQCWLTDNVEGNSDVDGGATILISPSLDIPGDGWVAAYWRWYSNDFGGSPNADILTVEWSEVGASSWQNLETVGPSGPGTSGGWIRAEFDLDASGLAGVDAFQIRVTADDSGSGSVIEAGLDGIQVSRIECEDTPCPGDMDGSGAVDVNDVLQVLGAYGSNDPAGDVNGDGTVDVNDILAVVAAFGPC
jgi:murein tripeptide amidase MpaA